jgi:23S rRNA (cytidine1920-2'-O)/16S rRNA (cytidine1409-2'-O)-methyltransferase
MASVLAIPGRPRERSGRSLVAAARRPLDQVLVARGSARDLEEARSLIESGRVVVGGAPALHPARRVSSAEPILVLPLARFVGRGGEKLEAALERFAVSVAGRTALDAGSSTGGFTDCLLQQGAVRVLAVDVGRAQLHHRLLQDPRVVSMERTNIRDVDPAAVRQHLDGDLASIVTVDLSFTSLAAHAPHLVALAVPGADLVALVKPQFEVDRATASKGSGVIRDPEAWAGVLARCASALQSAGAGIMGAMASPIRGAEGNVEFLLHARRGIASSSGAGLEEALAEGIALLGGRP